MLEFFGYFLLAIICIPIIFLVVNISMALIWLPISKGMDFLFQFPLGRLLLAPVIFVAVAIAGMRLFPSLVFGCVIGGVGVYILLWGKNDRA
ncbi:hypothetical protein [Vibrio crassostreae]|uniref:hypothetical protein n=1 Tax=Vibrio crassostreae TaxID=246167 RepID=UPI001049280E|nr:hypothetical protein [Vibrio crassostreae]TCN91082.1 hypothetical protein EDB37_100388 [Vibrio crassostreae]